MERLQDKLDGSGVGSDGMAASPVEPELDKLLVGVGLSDDSEGLGLDGRHGSPFDSSRASSFLSWRILAASRFLSDFAHRALTAITAISRRRAGDVDSFRIRVRLRMYSDISLETSMREAYK